MLKAVTLLLLFVATVLSLKVLKFSSDGSGSPGSVSTSTLTNYRVELPSIFTICSSHFHKQSGLKAQAVYTLYEVL